MSDSSVEREMGVTSSPRPRYLRRVEAAAYIQEKSGSRSSPKTLAKLACVGGGPPFRKFGRIPVYDPSDLDDWIASRLSKLVRSTSELEAA
jgi:hypothetical protein